MVRCEELASEGEPEGILSEDDELPDGGVESLDDDTGGVYGIEAPRRGADAVGTAAESVGLATDPGASLSEVDELFDEVLDEVPS